MKNGLLLVDIQNDYFPGGKMELAGINEASVNANTLLSHFREKGWPTFHIQHVSVHEGATFFLPDSDGVDLHDRIMPLPGERIITKHFPNSFKETTLQKELEAQGVEQVTICGAMSHMCIDATTRAAADLGYICTVVHDACATKKLEFEGDGIEAEAVHGAFMAALGAGYARVTDTAAFLSRFTD